MDYGKLAYLKAVDLEDILSNNSASSFGVVTTELKNLRSGINSVCTILGKGEIAAYAISSVSADFFVDGIKVCSGSNVFFKIVDGGEITVSCNQAISELRFMAIGNVNSSEVAGSVYADYNGDTLCYLVAEGGTVSVFTTNVGLFSPTLIFEGNYIHGDVCAYKNGFLICVVDSGGMVKMFTTSGLTHAYYLDASKVAIQADDFAIRIAYLKNGGLYYMELEDFDSLLPLERRISYSGYIDDLRFVRKSTKLLFSSGGKCYAKELDIKDGIKDKLYVYLLAEVV
ncbi:MAG: hypothetical protein IKC35_01655 [Clostridia bacterium]|nr:hypothetical protein [Clostridia bacterium]